MKKLQKTAQDAALLAAEKSSKCSVALEVVKCITAEVFFVFPLNTVFSDPTLSRIKSDVIAYIYLYFYIEA